VENFKKKPSWALSYQEWQSYIISCQINHDAGIEAAATGNKESDSSTDDSDESMKTSSDEDDSEASDFNDKKAGANNVCNWGQVIQCNLTELLPLKCQKDGCSNLVHHLCQGNWEQSNGHSNTIARYCFSHHPNNTSNDNDVFWDDDEQQTGKTVVSTADHLQSNTVNSGSMNNIQNYGDDAAIHELCVKFVKTLPICGGENWQGMTTNENSNKAKTVAHSVARNAEDPFSSGEDPDLFSNANLKQEVSSNVNRTVKSSSVDFFITRPFNNEKTGRSVWSIVLGDSGKSWALKDTFVKSYLQTLLLKREKNRASDIDISFCQSFYKINILNNKFGKESVWSRKSPVRGKPGQIVKHLSFVYRCPTSNVAK
jgi:hypothetical protein